jgi:hypothetical protein
MRRLFPWLIILSMLLASCGGEPTLPATIDPAQYQIGENFTVEAIDLEVGQTLPSDATLVVRGNFPDSCTQIYQVSQQRTGHTIIITLTTARPIDAVCTQALTPHTERIRIGQIEEAGTYTLIANDFTGTFFFGQIPTIEPSDYSAEVTVPLQTPDGGVQLLSPAGWVSETNVGLIRIAATEQALNAELAPPAALVAVTVATGPYRAQDFDLDGRTVSEAYAFFALSPMARTGPPDPLEDSRWPGLVGFASDSTFGARELRVCTVDEQTTLVILSYSPEEEWESFQPVSEAIIASIQVQ